MGLTYQKTLHDEAARSAAIEYLQNVTLSDDLNLRIATVRERRDDRYNRLMWSRHAEVAKQLDSYHGQSKLVHGVTKHEILMPLQLEWWIDDIEKFARVRLVGDIMDRVPDYYKKLMIAYDMIRTNDLTEDEFKTFMRHYYQYWAERGVRFTDWNRS